jgi:hypothetical protein
LCSVVWKNEAPKYLSLYCPEVTFSPYQNPAALAMMTLPKN